MDPSEKAAKTPRDLLNLFVTVTRFWQWGSSVFISLSVNLLFHQTRIYSSRVKAIQPLVLVSLGYSTLVLVFVILLNKIQRLKTSSWHIFAMTSIPGDLLMLSVFVAKVAVLSIQYFECSVLARTDSFEDLMTQGTRETILTLVGGPHSVAGHPQCHFPNELYALSVVAIFTYIMSILFTGLQLWRYRKALSTIEAGPHPGHVVEVVSQRMHRPIMARVERPPPPPPPRRLETQAGPSQGRPPIPAPAVEAPEDPKYANMPEGIIASMAVGRSSQETTSSFNPDLYLITDGFRPPDEPPAYTSRPSSLYGGF